MQNIEGAVATRPHDAFPESREKKIILLLCILAAIHVFIFSAAFPFFNNVDEPAHFDLVLQYSHGHLPHGEENTSKEASVYLALFCSCAYFGPTVGEIPPPPWTQPVEKMQKDLIFNSTGWQTTKNYEVAEPPLYYTLAGLCWQIGKCLGLTGGRLLYLIHFLNVVFIVALVWLAYITARMVFPENPFIRLAVPALMAFIPQTAFYSIGNDALSPVCFGLLFICLIKWLNTDHPSRLLGTATGLAFAATYLTKMTNLALLVIAAAAIAVKTYSDIRKGKFRETLPALGMLLSCAAPLIIGWMVLSKIHFGDFSGSKLKTEHWGLTIKPFNQWWHHPIFTPAGLWTYLSGQLATFWQGEFKWYYHPPAAQPLDLAGTDFIYTLLSLVLIALAISGLFQRTNPVQLQRQALQLSLACFIVVLVFFAFLSIIYDFHNSPYPSRLHPYFRSGRMLLGALIPFFLLFVYGLDRALARFGNTTKFVALAIMISVMLVVEIATDWPAFFNEYNWFHLP